ncbi:hypothetical protein FBU30_002167 [Linnemannia zychae]|nr:hypothetical protein FBU30_002167 [Linnemannia zychae]
MKDNGDSLHREVPAQSPDIDIQTPSPKTDPTPPILSANSKKQPESSADVFSDKCTEPELYCYGQPDSKNFSHHRTTSIISHSSNKSDNTPRPTLAQNKVPVTVIASTSMPTLPILTTHTDTTSALPQLNSHPSPLQTFNQSTTTQDTTTSTTSTTFTNTNASSNPPTSAPTHTTTTPPIEVVMKTAEIESPTTMLRHRRSNGTTRSTRSSMKESSPTRSSIDTLRRFPTMNESDRGSTGDRTIVPPPKRKPSFSSTRDHVPSEIKTEQLASFKLKIDEASPVNFLGEKRILPEGNDHESGQNNNLDNNNNDDNKESDDDYFDWEEDKIYVVKQGKDVQSSSNEKLQMLQDDVCCPHCRIHPWILMLMKHIVILTILLIPKFVLHHVHSHHRETIVLIEDGNPYMGVVIGHHIGYFVIQLLIMALFKIIYNFGSVKVKIILETHDGLVPHIARSCWLFILIGLWATFVHNPTCLKARGRLDPMEILPNGVDMHCRAWIFWWVCRCLWGIQAMNMLYIMKRYTMQILSDRFEQDNSRFIKLNFQGHVLDGLQKIKQPRANRLSTFHAHHYYGHLGHYHNNHRWTEKPTSWLANTYQGTRSPIISRPGSPRDDKPMTASIVADSAAIGGGGNGHGGRGIHKQYSIWQLLKRSITRRTKFSRTNTTGTSTSTIGSITDGDKDHELEPQEFVRMSKKRKSKLINSLRNKPIENPNKKAKELWARICPAHRNHLERMDIEQAFKKENMDRVWKLFDPAGGDIITRAMFKQTIVDMVNLRKSFTSTHKTFENAMAKLDMLFNGIVLLFVIVAFLIAFDVGVQQFALLVGCAFVTGTSAKNAFESMVFIFVMRRKWKQTRNTTYMHTCCVDPINQKAFDVGDRIEMDGAYFTIITIHILSTELKRGDGMLKQRIQNWVEGEAVGDFLKIDVIVNSTNNHTKDGTSKACLQILFRVFHRCRWIDSDFGPRKLKSILFLRSVLNELEQEDLKDLIALRRVIGYGDHGDTSNNGHDQPQQQSLNSTPVVNEAGMPVGIIGTSGNVYDLPNNGAEAGSSESPTRRDTNPFVGAWSQNELDAIYLACDVAETAQRTSIVNALQQNGISSSMQAVNSGDNNNTLESQQEPESISKIGTGVQSPKSPASLHQQRQQYEQRSLNYNLDSRHILVPETIQLSTNAANFQPFPNGFQFQR